MVKASKVIKVVLPNHNSTIMVEQEINDRHGEYIILNEKNMAGATIKAMALSLSAVEAIWSFVRENRLEQVPSEEEILEQFKKELADETSGNGAVSAEAEGPRASA